MAVRQNAYRDDNLVTRPQPDFGLKLDVKGTTCA